MNIVPPRPVRTRPAHTTLWLIVLAGLALRLAWWAHALPAPVSDFEYYRRLAATLLEHGQLGYPAPSALRVPGYPLFLAALMIVSRSIAWLSLANALLSAVLPYLVYRVADVVVRDRAVALGAALLMAIHPNAVLFAPVLASEHLCAILFFAALLVLCQAREQSAAHTRRTANIAGLIFGAAILTRPDSLFYLPAFVATGWCVIAPARRRLALVAFVLTAAVAVLPWYVRNRVMVGPGAGLSTISGKSFYFAHNSTMYGYHSLEGTRMAGLTELERHKRGYEIGFEYIRHATAKQLVADVVKATGFLYAANGDYGQFWSTRATGPNPDEFTANDLGKAMTYTDLIIWWNRLLVAAALAAVVFVRRYPLEVWWAFAGLVVLNWVGYCVVFEATPRYRHMIEPALCVLAVLTLRQAFAAARGRTAP
jgi:hypothetical protein